MRKITIELDGELEMALDRAAGRLTYRMPEPRIPVSLEQVALMALQRGIPVLDKETVIRTPMVDGTLSDPSEPFRPSRRKSS
jgi:hypothetical protein